jgi:hypothetical protein
VFFYRLRAAVAAVVAMLDEPDQECMGYARECVRLATLASDPTLQQQLLMMALEWMATAMDEPPFFDGDLSMQ